MRRREFLGESARWVGVAALAVSAGSCAQAPSVPSARKRGTPGVASGPPRTGGTLRVGTFSEVSGFDPTADAWDTTGYLYGETVFDPLAAFAADGTPRPYLAEAITPSPDYSSWTITLRPGVSFHDGSPLDAHAVHLNLVKQIASPLVGPALSNIAGVEVAGPLAVTVQMHEPWVPFPYYLADQPGYIAAPSMLEDPNGSNKPVGTGPFVFESWEPNVAFTARANPRYWRKGLPYAGSVEFRPFSNPAAMSASLLSGALDVVSSTDQATIVYFSRDSSYVVVDDRRSTTVQPDQNCVILNTAKAPLDDLRVRRALAHSVDQQAVVNSVFSGLGEVSDGPFVKGSEWYAPSGYPTYDLAQARSLVAQYRAEKGPVHITFGIPSGDATYTQVAELLQGMWNKIGVSTQIGQEDIDSYELDAAAGNYQADGWQQFSCDDPDENYVWWSTDTVAPVGKISLNVARNADPRIQSALKVGRTNPDHQARVDAYQSVARYLAEDLPYLWVNRSVSAVIATPHLQNFNATTLPDGSPGQGVSGGTFRLSTAWLA